MPVFIQYQMSSEEAIQGEALNPIQVRSIQNLIATIAEEKLRLRLDPDKPQHFIQQESHLAGQIEILEYLISRSDSANNTITA